MKQRIIDTPLGMMMLYESQGRICRAEFVSENQPRCSDVSSLLDEAERQIKAYFSGELTCFSLPMTLIGTEFEQDVLRTLLKIPYGQTRSYAEIARMLGRTGAARAVGRACARNPLLLLIPCHRVIAANGMLSGFAAGVERKLIGTSMGHTNFDTTDGYIDVEQARMSDVRNAGIGYVLAH